MKPIRAALAGTFAALLVAACVPVTPQPPPPPPPPPPTSSPDLAVDASFETDNVGTGPVWDVAFLPDATGDLFFSRRSGAIRFRTADGTKTTVQNPVPNVLSTGGEGGLMGLAVDPSFATNRYLFACYSWDDPASSATDNRVVRFTVNATFTGVDATLPIVVGMPHNPAASGRHSGCRLRFKPGTDELFIGTGDAAGGTNPQSLTSLGGKTLRVTRDGAAYPGNPVIAGGLASRIWTYGHRNVQGISFRPGDLQPFSAEHGTGCDDEVNKLVAGKNGGWNPVPGYDESRPMTDLSLPNAVAPMWASGCPTLAPSGAAFLDGAQWEGWNGALAVAMLKTQKLTIMFMNANGTVTSTFDALTNGVRLRSPVQGPDGNLYVGTDDGRIWKVTPS